MIKWLKKAQNEIRKASNRTDDTVDEVNELINLSYYHNRNWKQDVRDSIESYLKECNIELVSELQKIKKELLMAFEKDFEKVRTKEEYDEYMEWNEDHKIFIRELLSLI